MVHLGTGTDQRRRRLRYVDGLDLTVHVGGGGGVEIGETSGLLRFWCAMRAVLLCCWTAAVLCLWTCVSQCLADAGGKTV